MKKFFTIISLIIICITINAKDFQTVKEVMYGDGLCSLVEGSVSVIGEKAPATLVFDFSKAHYGYIHRRRHEVEDKGPISNWINKKEEDGWVNWDELVKNSLEASKETINKNNAYKLYIDDKDPKYEIKLVFEYVNPGSYAAIATPGVSGGAAFTGNLIITEIATGKVALNLHLDYIYGDTPGFQYTSNERMKFTLGTIFFGRYLPAVYKKNK